MLKNYFRIAFRQFKRNKLFSLINIAGLGIGISACLVIYLIVQHEYSFDQFHKEKDQKFRVVTRIAYPDLVIHNGGIELPAAKAIRSDVTGIALCTQFVTTNDMKVSIPSNAAVVSSFKKQTNIIFADNYYFSFFEYKWLAGNAANALSEPFKVVLTEDRAFAYFGTKDYQSIIGRQLLYEDSIKATVAGIVERFPATSEFKFEQFISFSTVEETNLKDNWDFKSWNSISSSSICFVKLNKGASKANVEKQFIEIRKKYGEKSEGDTNDEIVHVLQPINEIHFDGDYDRFGEQAASKATLRGLSAVGLFLLILGCINFINLTTAQSSSRAKEIGIRKTMGSAKSQLVRQFLSETFLLTLVATALSIALSPWLLKVFSDYIPKGVTFASLNQPSIWIFLLSLIIIITIAAGIYPALVLTRFKPVTVLKNQGQSGSRDSRKAWLRKSLTIVQFVIAQFLIIATWVVSKQVAFSLSKDLGYKKEAIISFDLYDFNAGAKEKREALQKRLSLMPDFEKVSLAGYEPASMNTNTSTLTYNSDKGKLESMVEIKYADTNYFDLFKMKLVAGRNLYQSDTTTEYIINETYAHTLGFKNPADAIGHMIELGHNIPIVGVISDFHTKSTHLAIKPLAYSSFRNRHNVMHVALKQTGDNAVSWKKSIDKIKATYADIFPDKDFEYRFFDESIAKFYDAERNTTNLLKWAAGLCIFISCLGLLGLVIFITNSRTKEIGVRKVLGASVMQIITLLSKDFLWVVFLAFLVTLPLAWWAMNAWLQDFQYKTVLSWWIFIGTGAGMLIVAMIVLALRTFKPASANPVKSLRTE